MLYHSEYEPMWAMIGSLFNPFSKRVVSFQNEKDEPFNIPRNFGLVGTVSKKAHGQFHESVLLEPLLQAIRFVLECEGFALSYAQKCWSQTRRNFMGNFMILTNPFFTATIT